MSQKREDDEGDYYECSLRECSFRTKDITRMKDHDTFHKNPYAFMECGCGKQHKLRRYMQDCIRRQKGLKPKQKNKKKAKKTRHACQRPGCKKSYANKRALTDHVICHDYPSAFVCQQCGTRFQSRQSLRVCQNSHAEGRPTFPCEWPDCEQVFDQEIYLENHAALHENPLAFACQMCGRPHKSMPMKERCEINHLNHPEMGHRCPRPECLAELSPGISLDAHEKRHLNAREHPCSQEECEKRFNLRSDADRHFKLIHGSGFCRACKICGHLSKKMKDLVQHIRTEHGEDIQIFDLSEENHANICENAILHLKAQYLAEDQDVVPGVLRPDWERCQMSVELRQTYGEFWRDLAKRVLELKLYPVDGFRTEVCAYWDDRKTQGASQVSITPVQYDELMCIVAAKGWHAYGVAAHFKLTRSLERSWFKFVGPQIASDLGTSCDELVAVARANLLAEILGCAQDPEEDDGAGEEDDSEDEDEDEDEDEGKSETSSEVDSESESESDDDDDSSGGDDAEDNGAPKRSKKTAQQPPPKQRLPARRKKSEPSRREAQEKADAEKEKAAQEQALQALKEANKAGAAARRAAWEEDRRRMREEDSDYDAEEEARKEKAGEEYRAAKAAQEKERQARKRGKFKPVHPSKRPKS